ncbi:MAG: ABC transporter permease [Lachnospiraceae bacterium]|nr:ABC transporter permease [Lachnospiraceae bacterium]
MSKKKIPKRHKNRRSEDLSRSIRTLSLLLLILYCANNITSSCSALLQSILYESVEARTVVVSAFGDWKSSAAYADGEESWTEYVAGFDQKEEEFLAWLDANPEKYSYTERVTLSLRSEETYGIGTASSYDYEAIRPYLIGEAQEELHGNEAVIAKYITGDSLGNYWARDEIYDGEQLVGQTIRCTASWYAYGGKIHMEKEYEVRIVGVYDNAAAGLSNRSELLMSPEELKTMQYVDESVEIYDDEGQVINWSDFEERQYSVVVKDYEELAEFQELTEETFHLQTSMYTLVASPSVWILQGEVFVMNLVLYVLTFNQALSMIYAVEHDIRTRRREFGLLKAMGYRDGAVNRILLKENLFVVGCAVGITALLGNLVLFGLHRVVTERINVYYKGISFFPHSSVALFVLALGISAPLIGYLAGTKTLRRMETVRMMSEGDGM